MKAMGRGQHPVRRDQCPAAGGITPVPCVVHIKVANQGASVVTTPPFAGDTASACPAWPQYCHPGQQPGRAGRGTLENTLVLLTFPSRVILIAAPGFRPDVA